MFEGEGWGTRGRGSKGEGSEGRGKSLTPIFLFVCLCGWVVGGGGGGGGGVYTNFSVQTSPFG